MGFSESRQFAGFTVWAGSTTPTAEGNGFVGGGGYGAPIGVAGTSGIGTLRTNPAQAILVGVSGTAAIGSVTATIS